MQFRKTFYSAAGAFAMMLMAGTARADYNGIGWIVPDAVAQNATLANANAQAGNTNRVTFTVNSLNFSSYGNASNTGNPSAAFTIGTFLNSLGQVTGVPVYSGTATPGTALNAGGNGMLFEFFGTANFSAGQAFSLTHDDGVQLYIGCTAATCTAANLVLNQPGPSSPVTTNFVYSGAQGVGNQSFVFVYGECCSAPAVFETTLVPPTQVPEPSSVMLFGTVLIGVVTAIRRKMA